jgi:hypothetical protein
VSAGNGKPPISDMLFVSGLLLQIREILLEDAQHRAERQRIHKQLVRRAQHDMSSRRTMLGDIYLCACAVADEHDRRVAEARAAAAAETKTVAQRPAVAVAEAADEAGGERLDVEPDTAAAFNPFAPSIDDPRRASR